MRLFKILSMMLLLAVVVMTGCGRMNPVSLITDTTPPTVSFTVPISGATSVAVNSKISATFSEAMDSTTITTANFTLKQGATTIAGTVVYTGVTAVFTPSSNLTANAIYSASITTGAKDKAGNALAAAKTWTFTTKAGTDTTAPTVSFTSPTDLDVNVAINKKVAATFSEAMDPTTITTSTFTLKQGTTAIACDVSYVGFVATLNPTSNLAANTVYTAKISGATDLAGNALVDKTWSFTTSVSGAVDTTAPTVTLTAPADLANGVAINGNITATFSEAMDPATINNTIFTLTDGTTTVTADVTYVGLVATLNPVSNLANNTTYYATITTSAQDLAGNGLSVNKTWSFTTAAVLDTTAPVVNSVSPTDEATGVIVNSNVTATFDEAMDPTSISTATFTLKQGTTVISGEVTYFGTLATFNPTGNLSENTLYTAKISTDAKDLAGNTLVANKTWTFTTGSTEGVGPAPVVLGTSGDYAILSKAGIALAVGATAKVYGNIGVSPAAATYITNASLIMDSSNTFSTSTQVMGTYKVYAATYSEPTPSNLTTAINNMETAYTDAAGRSNPTATELGAGEIGGMTLVPGFYKWSSSLNISTDLYLSGGANDTWIFEVAGDLTLANGIQVHMTGGAQAKNVFWQVAGHATLGTTSVMNGNMICLTDMTMLTGSTLNGRLLAQTAVTLQENTTVNLP